MKKIKTKPILSDKAIAWLVTHSAFIVMTLILMIDYTQWNIILMYSGYFALGFFIITLALNPLGKISDSVLLFKLNRYRRQLGVASFSYALLHATCFIIKRLIYGKWIFMLHPAIIPVLFIGFPLLLALALTSNQPSIKKLGFAKWKSLHNTVYIAEAAIFIHLILSGYKILALTTFVPLFILQFIRRRINQRKKST